MSAGWTFEAREGSHSWGLLKSPRGDYRVFVWSTPRDARKHALDIARAVARNEPTASVAPSRDLDGQEPLADGEDGSRPTFREYTTAVVSEDGALQAEVISIPRYFVGQGAEDPLAGLAADLGVERSLPVTEQGLSDLLEQLAYETVAGRDAQPTAVARISRVVTKEPVVVVEQSPAIGKSLAALVSQGGPAYILFAEGQPFLALAVEGALVIVWFVAGPVQGVREGLRDGAHDATKTVAHEVIETALRERFSRPSR